MSGTARTAEHKAKLAADPRFAAWQGLSAPVAAGLQLDPFYEPEDA